MTDKEEGEDYQGVAPIKIVIKKMKKDYDKNPKGWRIIGSSDKHGNTDTFITKKPDAYWLKSKMLNPYSSLTMGSLVRNIDKDIDEKVGKKLSSEDMLRLFGMIVPVKKDQNIIAAGIEKYSQQHGDHLKKVIHEGNSNLGYQLARRVDEEFTKKYPQRKNLYI
ncbi:MAG: hypothetical protein ACXACC_00325 [Promethearchaeota archaeon]|jgi:hypothetical protein